MTHAGGGRALYRQRLDNTPSLLVGAWPIGSRPVPPAKDSAGEKR